MKQIIIADDHAVVRTGLNLIFQLDGNLDVADEVQNGQELLDCLSNRKYDTAIIDLNMPGKDSLDLVAEVRKRFPHLPIVIYSMNTDEQLALRLFKMGVKAYINKEESQNEILNAVKQVVGGNRYLTQAQKNLFAERMIKGENGSLPQEKLTDREYQILRLVAAGCSKTEIAEKLSISKNTISNHRNNILKKLNVANNAELTRFAIQHQLVN